MGIINYACRPTTFSLPTTITQSKKAPILCDIFVGIANAPLPVPSWDATTCALSFLECDSDVSPHVTRTVRTRFFSRILLCAWSTFFNWFSSFVVSFAV